MNLNPLFAGIAVFSLAVITCAPISAQENEEEEIEEHEEEFENPLNLTEEDVLQFLEEKFPEALADLNEIREEEGEEIYQEDLGYAMEFLTEYRFLTEENPAAAENFLKAERMEYQLDAHVEKVHEADSDAAREEATEVLRKHVEEMIDIRIAIDEAELGALEQELAELRSLVTQRKAERQAEVDETMRELLEEDEEDDEDEDDEEENEE